MACFLVPGAEAIVTKVAEKVIERKTEHSSEMPETPAKIPFARKLKWLTNLLFGGSVLLAFEHLWHGEISPFFPFLTAASDPAALSEVLHEMATAGVAMAVLCTAVWGVMLAVAAVVEKKAATEASMEENA